ncbi:hypothetical protein INR49_002213 [Caranx melampygus]|nr:hypothetical protein INR49_002213 [Caranx melampygus]
MFLNAPWAVVQFGVEEMDEHMRTMLHHRELEKLKGRAALHGCSWRLDINSSVSMLPRSSLAAPALTLPPMAC